IQTVGRAARNARGTAIMYADRITGSMEYCIDETNRRRAVQEAYNREHGIDPQSIRKKVSDILLSMSVDADKAPAPKRERRRRGVPEMPTEELERLIRSLEEEMHEAAKDLRFEYAARLRDEVQDLRRELEGLRRAGVGS
ncbi:MAG TPA: UvrB/UvrC motif-containing protein, partial [Actinomycetota bacterium]|nr:UvrB/UvrC motif-containing protein [Actinomycetota bacterium]